MIAAAEIRGRLEGATVRGTRAVGDRNGLVQFDYGGPASALSALRTVEDLFVLAVRLPQLPPTRAALRLLEAMARTAPLETPLTLAQQVAPGLGGRGKRRFRVIARQAGQTLFRRGEAQRAVEQGIAARQDHSWRLAEGDALEFWLTLLPGEAILALRLTDARTRHRDYKIEHLPASLRPSAAAALVWLTRPAPEDVFLDPMCGAGTLLIERAHAGRYAMLLGGDVRPEAIAAARANIGPRYKPIEVREWDARHLPLDAASVTAAAVNVPFGKQLGTPRENRALYPAVLKEAARVLRPAARLVALTGDTRVFEEALSRALRFARREVYPVQVLGQSARVYVLERV